MGKQGSPINEVNARILQDILRPDNGHYILDYKHVEEQWKTRANDLGYSDLYYNPSKLRECGLKSTLVAK